MMDDANIETLKMLITSQKSLGDNIEKLYETVTERGRQLDRMLAKTDRMMAESLRERRAMLAAIRAYLEGTEGEDGPK